MDHWLPSIRKFDEYSCLLHVFSKPCGSRGEAGPDGPDGIAETGTATVTTRITTTFLNTITITIKYNHNYHYKPRMSELTGTHPNPNEYPI